MFEYSSLEPEKTEGIEVSDVTSIDITNIDFRFNGRSRLLNEASIFLRRGAVTCLLGESGSGKTILTEILQKNYIPENGDIIVNKNTNLKDISINNWRTSIGTVPQNIQLFNGTALENIVLDENVDQQKLQEVLFLGFDQFISSLPQGLLTLTGEKGINLSGGQKQLLGWMRALYHNPQILILDKPTSSLDNENRTFIYKLIEKIKSEKIIFIISHYLEDVKEISDQLLILKNNRISELDTGLSEY